MTNKAAADFPVFVALAKTTNFVGRAGAIPFVWSKESRELEAKRTWKILTFLKQLVLILHILFTLFQLFYFAQAKSIPVLRRISVFYTTLGVIVVAYNVYVVYRDPGALQALVNSLIRTSRRFHGDHFHCRTDPQQAITIRNSKSVIRAVRLATFAFTFIGLTYSLRIIRDPGNNRYLTSLLPKPENSTPLLRLAVGTFHMTAHSFEFFTFSFTFSFSLVFVCIVVDMMEKLR